MFLLEFILMRGNFWVAYVLITKSKFRTLSLTSTHTDFLGRGPWPEPKVSVGKAVLIL